MKRLLAWLRDTGTRLIRGPDSTAENFSDPAEPARWARLVMWVGFVVFLIWAFTAPLSQGVPTSGFIKVKGSVKTIQHLRGGIVDELLVRDGDHVTVGQALIRLNDVQLKAQVGVLEAQLLPAMAVEARLLAERAGAKTVSFPKVLMDRDDSTVREAMRVQVQSFQARRASLAAEITMSGETINALEEQIRGIGASQAAKREQLRLYRSEYANLKPVYEEGFVPRNRLFELERAIASLDGGLSEDNSNMARARIQISETRARMNLSEENYRKEVDTLLTEMQRQIGDVNEKLTAVRDDLSRVILRSPVEGTVTASSVTTVGGVIAPGQKLLDIVPSGESLLIETQIPTHLIDNVRVGLPADVNFLALDRTLIPTVSGTLSYVSADRQVDERHPENSYYIGRVEMNETELKKLGTHLMQPGMPVEVVIKTGERTFAGYLFKPVFARLNVAMLAR